MKVSLPGAVSVPSVGERGDDRQDIRRRCEQERIDITVAERRDDRREEVGDGAGGDDAEQHEHEDPHLDILNRELETVEEVLLFTAKPIILTNVLVEAPDGKLAFFFGEPACCAREVGKGDEGEEGDEDGNSAFNDEEPAPGPG